MAAYTVAEKLTGFRLERRTNYLIKRNGQDKQIQTCTLECSGCSCDCGAEYRCSYEASDCSKCGHTGKRRMTFGFPGSPLLEREAGVKNREVTHMSRARKRPML